MGMRVGRDSPDPTLTPPWKDHSGSHGPLWDPHSWPRESLGEHRASLSGTETLVRPGRWG